MPEASAPMRFNINGSRAGLRAAMRLRLFFMLLAVMVIGVGAAGAAPTVSDAAKAMVGSWEFSNADRDKRCTLSFSTDAAAVGFKLEFEKGCADRFAFTKDVVGWTLGENEFLRLVDARGRALLEFSELETGLFEAPMPGEGILFIQTAAAVGPAPKPSAEMAGEWSIARGSAAKQVCALTLSDKPAGPETFVLTVKAGCDPAIVRLNLTNWQMDRSELVLSSAKGDSWRFEEVGDGNWQRVPESAEPVLMVRR